VAELLVAVDDGLQVRKLIKSEKLWKIICVCFCVDSSGGDGVSGNSK
jgi:hypothetical protein